MKNEKAKKITTIDKKCTIGFFIFPDFTLLDFFGPFEVFSRVKDQKIDIIAETTNPVIGQNGISVLPTVSYKTCPDIDILSVVGGPGIDAILKDEKALSFLSEKGSKADYISSVCTGSLLLGAAGLLNGYQASSHWMSKEHLEQFGAIVSTKRVVEDRNRITSAGVSAGIDMALHLVSKVWGKDLAKRIQIMIEYDSEEWGPSPEDEDIKSSIRETERKTISRRKTCISNLRSKK